MAYPYLEIAELMKWSNMKLQRKIDTRDSGDSYLTLRGEVLTSALLAKKCKSEMSRRKRCGIYIEEAGEWDRFENEDYTEEDTIEERNAELIKSFRKAPRKHSLLNIGRKR